MAHCCIDFSWWQGLSVLRTSLRLAIFKLQTTRTFAARANCSHSWYLLRKWMQLLYFRARKPKATRISNPSPPVPCGKPVSPRLQNLSTCQRRGIITHYHSTMAWWQQSRVRNTTTSVQTPWTQQLSSAALAGHLASHIRYATAGWKDSFNASCRLETTWWISNVYPQKVNICSAWSTIFCGCRKHE